MRPRVYISLPVRGRDLDEVRNTADVRAEVLATLGCVAVNPMRNGLPADAPYCDHMRVDYGLLATCDAILMCEGWEYSHGCKNELQMAADMRLRVLYNHMEYRTLERMVAKLRDVKRQ